jgi:hypothetical protein
MEADQEIYAKWLAAGSQVFILEARHPDDAIYDNGLVDNGLIEGLREIRSSSASTSRARTTTRCSTARASGPPNCYFERMNGVAWAEQRRRIKRAVGR